MPTHPAGAPEREHLSVRKVQCEADTGVKRTVIVQIAKHRPKMVAWTQGAGQQWLTTDKTPEAGSDLALDDASGPKVSQIAAYCCSTNSASNGYGCMTRGIPARH
jgi:hypothetical protein